MKTKTESLAIIKDAIFLQTAAELRRLIGQLASMQCYAAQAKLPVLTDKVFAGFKLQQAVTVFSKELEHLITEVTLTATKVDPRTNPNATDMLQKLISVSQATVDLLNSKLSIADYKNIALDQRTGSNTVMGRIGALMFALSNAFKNLGCSSISRGLTTMGIYAQNGIGKPMLELAKYKGFDDRIKEEGGESQLFLPPI